MSKVSSVDMTVADLSGLIRTIADAAFSDVAFAAVADAAETFIGHQLFTIMVLKPETMQVQRLYSSNPEAYPPSGSKIKRDTDWGRQVL